MITHKGGQRSDGSVSIHSSDSHTHTPCSIDEVNANVKLSSVTTYRHFFHILMQNSCLNAAQSL